MSVRVGMVSLGCAKNRVDAEMMLYTLKNAGYELSVDPAMSDVVIVNTCGFIEDAKQESIDEILELASLKKEGKIKAIIVTGCLAERYQHEVIKELYEVDAVLGIGANSDIVDVVEKVLNGEKQELYPDKTNLALCGGRIRTTPFYYSYLKIAEGCDNKCTYCAIPMIRGPFRSRPMDDILSEAEELSKKGVKELIVIAQDTSRYGEDIAGKSLLPELLTKLCAIESVCYVRVLYCYPERMTDELIDVFAKEDKILKYIDIPMQHCNGRILKLMNRHGDRQSLTALINKLRERIPNITIRTTFMTGFPSETEEEFTELSEFVNEMRFERMGCFAYSAEEDTPAAKLKDQIPEQTKKHRQELLMEQQQIIMAENAAKYVGKTIKVICEGFDRYAECFFGRSKADAPEVDGKVFFIAEGSKPKIGDIVNVDISDTLDCDLMGQYRA
ncbi:MAG: 30S ribosomal protein S12 methylthiotransferase RimO [Clostridia bacterium]|nr:30S ribosomal protein S12 methylthiotransferase RimO [Clostridia bacterium]